LLLGTENIKEIVVVLFDFSEKNLFFNIALLLVSKYDFAFWKAIVYCAFDFQRKQGSSTMYLYWYSNMIAGWLLIKNKIKRWKTDKGYVYILAGGRSENG
jgi:hypothetical protein